MAEVAPAAEGTSVAAEHSPVGPGPTAPHSAEQHRADNLILAIACIAQFMVVLDVSIVNVALPHIGDDLHYSATGLQWVVNAYVLTFAGFLLLGGRLADLFGRRRVFIGGLLLFSLASLLGGLAQSSGELTAARAVQGLGGAVLSPATLTIIMTTFGEGPPRHRALAAWSSVSGLGGAAGVILGGVLTSELSWRWVFYVNIPIGAATVFAALSVLSERRRPDAERSLDIPGAILVTGGLALLVYAIVGTDVHPWGSVRTIGLLVAAVAILGAFVVTQTRVKAPLMPLNLFGNRSVTAADLTMLLLGVAFFSMWYFLSLYLQDVKGNGPLRAGLLFLPMSAAIIVGARLAGAIIGRLGPRVMLVIGLGLSAVGFGWLTQLSATSSYAGGVLGGTLLISFGMGLSFTPLATAATAGVHWTQAGLASGLLNTARQVGGCIGLAALATVATDRTHSLLAANTVRYTPQLVVSGASAVTSGYDRAFAVAAVVCALGALTALAIPRTPTAPSA
ncbi:MAG TPA: MFS transporter [Mycobacteriales bacterium]|nr:MFS transporter [Mycobacteriales bacterium]